MIATLGETTGYPGLLWMKKKMEAASVGRLILKSVQLLSRCSWESFYLVLYSRDCKHIT